MASDTPFPIDWNEWRTEWTTWREEHRADVLPSSYRFPPKNFLADEVLGVFSVGRPVELSEVTFPDLNGERRGERVRYVGVTFGQASGCENGGLAASFAELERALGLA